MSFSSFSTLACTVSGATTVPTSCLGASLPPAQSIRAEESAAAAGPQGHEATGELAKLYLADDAKKGLADLFEKVRAADPSIPGEEFEWAQLSTWADRIKKEHPETAPWHYVDIPLEKDDFDK